MYTQAQRAWEHVWKGRAPQPIGVIRAVEGTVTGVSTIDINSINRNTSIKADLFLKEAKHVCRL